MGDATAYLAFAAPTAQLETIESKTKIINLCQNHNGLIFHV